MGIFQMGVVRINEIVGLRFLVLRLVVSISIIIFSIIDCG